jgi:ATP-binding cassette subfamily C protein
LSGGLRLTSSLLPLQGALLSIKQSIPPASIALDILEANDKSGEKAEATSEMLVPNGPPSLHLKDLNFSYDSGNQKTLENITIDIIGGSQAALIGTSGAGKSTLADLILGLLEPLSGSVRIGGSKPTEIIAGNPGLLGYVPQKPGMINGTIAENIALGVENEKINRKWLLKAISEAHLSDLIDSLPEGVETHMGKRKDELSGGQLQRIGLARALYTQPKLLVMDEATSALDAQSENHINMALDEMRGNVTVILIAHRLNTVQRSDLVFFMEEGRVTDSGTFPELLKKNKTVQNLANLMSIDNQE